MRAEVLVAEIGSTVTKVHALAGLNSPKPVWLGSGAAPTTVVEGDVTAGLNRAVATLQETLGGKLTWERMMAASSAAGGLRMSVHGLVYDMTVRAAREAALGAGAIIDLVTAGKMGHTELENLRRLRPGIILLSGGLENGDREVVTHNAGEIARLGLGAPVIYAGNSAARAEAVQPLEAAGLKVWVVANVYPRLDQLNIEPTRRVIQDVFEEHIVLAPGMQRVREMVGGSIRPTPGAVMEAARVLQGLIGDVVVLDVGGATTDVHSVTEGSPEIQRLQIHPEPFAKRTVEGDLGVYVNAGNVARLAGLEGVAAYRAELPGPESEVEALARLAVEIALVRHAGRLRYLYGPTGRVTVAEGKDLTEVKWLVGTGGPLSRLPHGRETLARLAGMAPAAAEAARRRGEGRGRETPGPTATHLLPGRGARPLLDQNYRMAALGVLHQEYPEAAIALLRESFLPDDSGGV